MGGDVLSLSIRQEVYVQTTRFIVMIAVIAESIQ